jgi:hypothetical protein
MQGQRVFAHELLKNAFWGEKPSDKAAHLAKADMVEDADIADGEIIKEESVKNNQERDIDSSGGAEDILQFAFTH